MWFFANWSHKAGFTSDTQGVIGLLGLNRSTMVTYIGLSGSLLTGVTKQVSPQVHLWVVAPKSKNGG